MRAGQLLLLRVLRGFWGQNVIHLRDSLVVLGQQIINLRQDFCYSLLSKETTNDSQTLFV